MQKVKMIEDADSLLQAIDEGLFNIDETDLTREYSRQASIYASIAVAAADAEREAALADLRVDQSYAEGDTYYRDELTAEGKKFTEATIKSMVMTDAEYIDACNALVDAKHRHRILRAAVDAAAQRADMLISMGAHLRAELSMTNMTLNEKRYNDNVEQMKANLRERR